MARSKTPKFLIGLFITLGVSIGVATVIWIGASKILQKGDLYVTYFDESVQGLSPDSMVKYRGVDVGRIDDINVAPDRRLIEVVMKVDLKPADAKDTVAQLKSAGLTGIVFVDLDRVPEGERVDTPRINFTPPYPLIPSQASAQKLIMSGLEMTIAKVKEIDLAGISNELKRVERSISEFFSGSTTHRILENLESTSAHMNHTLDKVDQLVAEGHLEGVLDDAKTLFQETKDAIVEARGMIEDVRGELKAMKLAETARRTEGMVTDLDRKTRQITTDLTLAGENIRQASENLDALLQRLEANPSELLFGEPPPPRRYR
ncbi:MAG: MCE family protein [Syntrophaceae bacterium]|nr:MCE family protein [Syntrophaceae bacterium]